MSNKMGGVDKMGSNQGADKDLLLELLKMVIFKYSLNSAAQEV